ncbi:MAG: glutathione S-transferase family protein [Planctomycetota bacterium]|jgi:glutathione S-transferase
MADFILYELPPSPNNVKVRIALGYKGIPYERRMVEFGDDTRDIVIKASGQPLTPAIEHGSVRLFGSAAILRYIDANFPDQGPRLFAATREGMYAIEEWEKFGRREAIQPLGMVINQMFSGQIDDEATKKANEMMAELSGKVEEQLNKTEFLAGDSMTAADITTAPVMFYAMIPEAVAATLPPAAFMRERLRLPEGRDKTRAWVNKVMAYDAGMPS